MAVRTRGTRQIGWEFSYAVHKRITYIYIYDNVRVIYIYIYASILLLV